MLNVHFQTCSKYQFYHNKSGGSMLAYFKIIVLLKGFVQSGHGRSGENFEECRGPRAVLLTRSLMTLSVCLTSRVAAERFCGSLPVEVLHLYVFNSSRPLPQFTRKKRGKREGRTSPSEGEINLRSIQSQLSTGTQPPNFVLRGRAVESCPHNQSNQFYRQGKTVINQKREMRFRRMIL